MPGPASVAGPGSSESTLVPASGHYLRDRITPGVLGLTTLVDGIRHQVCRGTIQMRNYPCHGVISVLPTQGACSSIKLISLLLVDAIAADDQQIIYGSKRLSICRDFRFNGMATA
jgi:hypothetical protein